MEDRCNTFLLVVCLPRRLASNPFCDKCFSNTGRTPIYKTINSAFCQTYAHPISWRNLLGLDFITVSILRFAGKWQMDFGSEARCLIYCTDDTEEEAGVISWALTNRVNDQKEKSKKPRVGWNLETFVILSKHDLISCSDSASIKRAKSCCDTGGKHKSVVAAPNCFVLTRGMWP